jgi:hypothetical protein
MQENNEIKFDAIVRRQIKKEGLESPSSDFTQSVLSKIEGEHLVVSDINNKPLISKPIWYALSALLIGGFVFLIFGDFASDVIWLPQISLQKIFELNLFGQLPQLTVSDTYVYAFIGLALFMGVQVYLLKNHFDKRYFMN